MVGAPLSKRDHGRRPWTRRRTPWPLKERTRSAWQGSSMGSNIRRLSLTLQALESTGRMTYRVARCAGAVTSRSQPACCSANLQESVCSFGAVFSLYSVPSAVPVVPGCFEIAAVSFANAYSWIKRDERCSATRPAARMYLPSRVAVCSRRSSAEEWNKTSFTITRLTPPKASSPTWLSRAPAPAPAENASAPGTPGRRA